MLKLASFVSFNYCSWKLCVLFSKVHCPKLSITTLRFAAYRSNNFIVGLTDNYPGDQLSSLWNYTLCGQYPGAVPRGRTVSVVCTNICERDLHLRYVVVQFPLVQDQMNFCEIEAYEIGKIVHCLVIGH